MSFKLSPQLDADANTAFELYKKYFEQNRWLFPNSVISVVENPDWSGGINSKSPHDAKLKEILISGIGTEDSIVKLLLFKSWNNLQIKITYSDILSLDFPDLGSLSNSPEWRYEQFLYFDPYQSHGIKNKKMFIHEIEWVNGVIWNITASNIEVAWNSA